MKKFLMGIVVLCAMMLTSCTHSTCTLQVVNEYSKDAIVYFSQNEKCTSPVDAELVAEVPVGKAVEQNNVKVDNLYAIIYVATGETSGDEVLYARKGVESLKRYAGNALVRVTVTSNGMYSVYTTNMY